MALNKKALLSLYCFFLLFISIVLMPIISIADVLYTHEINSDEYMSGTFQSILNTGFSGESMYVDKNINYTGTWMKRFFGKVKEQRDTTHILLDKNQIREIDWNKAEVVIFPIKNLHNIKWFREKDKFMKDADEMIKARYQVVKPEIKIDILPQKEVINGYECLHLTADLRLETKDLKKNSSSITNIQQNLWVSDAVPGFKEYENFHNKLSEKLGVEAARMGILSFLLKYWEGEPLEPVLSRLNGVKGFPVQSVINVEAVYISNTNSNAPEKISKNLKKETTKLINAEVTDNLNMSCFKESIPMRNITVE